jgi:hypothetical protein
MNDKLIPLRLGAAVLAACVAAAATAQSPRQQAGKELARTMPDATVQACALVTRADVTKAVREPYADPEPFGNGGWICNIGVGEVKLYSGPKSWEQWESTMKNFNKHNDPTVPASGFGERAYFFFPKRDNADQPNWAFLVVKSGNHTIALSLDTPSGKTPESMRPSLEALMRTMLGRLPAA